MNWKLILKSEKDPRDFFEGFINDKKEYNRRGSKVLTSLKEGLFDFISRWGVETYEDILESGELGDVRQGHFIFTNQYYRNGKIDFDAYNDPQGREQRIGEVLRREAYYQILVSVSQNKRNFGLPLFLFDIINGEGADPNFRPTITGVFAGKNPDLTQFDTEIETEIQHDTIEFLETLVEEIKTLPEPRKQLGGGSS